MALSAFAGVGGSTAFGSGTEGGARTHRAASSALRATFSPNYEGDVTALRHWDKKVITVGYVLPRPDSTGVVRDIQPLIRKAVALWNAELGGTVSFRFIGTNRGDVNVRLVPPDTLPGGAIGRTEVTFRDADQVLIDAAVKVDRSLSDELETQVLTHELGHSLGVEGHSHDDADLMYTRAHLPAAITARDRNTVELAYNGGAAESPGDVTYSVSACLPAAKAKTSTVAYNCLAPR